MTLSNIAYKVTKLITDYCKDKAVTCKNYVFFEGNKNFILSFGRIIYFDYLCTKFVSKWRILTIDNSNMASNADYVQYITDQCSGAGEIVAKKMFGDYGLYCDGKIVGLICDDCFYLKPTEAGKQLLRVVDMRPPYEGAKDYFFIADVDDRDYLSELVRETCRELPVPKPKLKKK